MQKTYNECKYWIHFKMSYLLFHDLWLVHDFDLYLNSQTRRGHLLTFVHPTEKSINLDPYIDIDPQFMALKCPGSSPGHWLLMVPSTFGRRRSQSGGSLREKCKPAVSLQRNRWGVHFAISHRSCFPWVIIGHAKEENDFISIKCNRDRTRNDYF